MSHLLFELLSAVRVLHTWLVTQQVRRFTEFSAFLMFWISCTSLFIPISMLLIEAIEVEAPVEFASACSLLLPSNTVPCFVTIATARLTAALYKKKIWLYRIYLTSK